MYKQLKSSLQLAGVMLQQFIEDYSLAKLKDNQKDELLQQAETVIKLAELARDVISISKNIPREQILATGTKYSILAQRLLESIFKDIK